MLYTRETVKDSIRNRDGKRVFYLGHHDQLTPGARDYLREQRIELLSADLAKPEEYRLLGGGILREKPDHMTHLRGNILVEKTHPIIGFRGAIDTLEAELILCQLSVPQQLSKDLGELLALARELIACDVLEKPLVWETLCGLTQEELRRRSHHPSDYYGQPHFMPEATDGTVIAQLNRCRCTVRQAELAAAHAFKTPDGCSRPDILIALNRMSSTLYLLMIQQKAGKGSGH
jgi:ethanolamine utilization cobalamin adenosyltransferase